MTEQVRVAGFAVPPVPAGADVTEHSRDRQPPNPANAVAGFVPPAPAPAAQPAPVAAPAAAPAVDPTLAALLAALGGAQPAVGTATAATAPAYNAGSDPVMQGLSGILTGSGIDVSKAIAKAIEYGDVSLIDKAYIASVGGANSAHLTQLAEQLVAHAGRESEAAEASCYALAGGQANFHAAVGVWNTTAPAHLKAIVENMMDSGVRAQSDAGARMIVEFAKGNGGLIQPAGLINAGASRPGSEAALSKEQFQAEMQKLDKMAPGYEQRRGELYGRRAMGKQMGR